MDIIGRRKIWFLISGLIIIPGIVSLIVWGLALGIDFKGGALLEIDLEKQSTVQEIKDAISMPGVQVGQIQPTKEGTYLIRLSSIDEGKHREILGSLNQKIGETKEVRFESVGPTVSRDLTRRALFSIIFASIAIILYIAWAFRRLPRPASSWRFGVCAILALIHDVLVVVGIFSILGHFAKIEVDSLFVTALLTIMGFSVHDTIVVFDRIRENLRLEPQLEFESVVNNSVVQTLARSLNTSLTVLLVLAALYLLGGATIKTFILALLVGITIGTYSSIFNASPLLVVWQNLRRPKGES